MDVEDNIGIAEEEPEGESEEDGYKCPKCDTPYKTQGEVNFCLGRHTRDENRAKKAKETPKKKGTPKIKTEEIDDEKSSQREVKGIDGSVLREDDREFYNLLSDNGIANVKTVLHTYAHGMSSPRDMDDPKYTYEILRECRITQPKIRTILRAKHHLRTDALLKIDKDIMKDEEPEKVKESKDDKDDLESLADFDKRMHDEKMKEMERLHIDRRLEEMRKDARGNKNDGAQNQQPPMMVMREPLLDDKGAHRIDSNTGLYLYKEIQVPQSQFGMGMVNPFQQQQPPAQPKQDDKEFAKELIDGFAEKVLKRDEEKSNAESIKETVSEAIKGVDEKWKGTVDDLKEKFEQSQTQLQDERKERKEEKEDSWKRHLERQVEAGKLDKEDMLKRMQKMVDGNANKDSTIKEKRDGFELDRDRDRSLITTKNIDKISELGVEYIDMEMKKKGMKDQPPADVDEEEKEFEQKTEG